MKILLTGDWQVNGRRSAYMDKLRLCLDHFRSVIHYYKPDLVVNLGDVMDTHSLVDVEDLTWAYEQIRETSRAVKGGMWVLSGNHDVSDRNCNVSSVRVFDEFSRVFLHPEYLEDVSGLNVLVLPYTKEVDETYKWLSDFNPDLDLILGHVDWIGCRLTPAYVSKSGFEVSWFQKRWVDIPIFNGHYHHPMDVGNLHLVGSPLHKDFNDILGPIERGFTLYDTTTKEITRIPNPHTYYCLQLTYENEESLRKGWETLRGSAEVLRVKVFVPSVLIDDAKEMFSTFLWSSVVPSDSRLLKMEHTSQITLQSTPDEVLTKGVDAAPDDYDRKTLRALGQKAFA